ncbi:hypothetical protein ACFLXZ_01035 [Chloroflexota bacterium]
MQVWAELKYGLKGQGVTICRLDSPVLLRAFKRSALRKAKQSAHQSNGVDEVIHLHDELELERLEQLLEKLIPSNDGEN